MASLLVQPTESRMHLLKCGERSQRCRDVALQTLRMGAQKQEVAILRHRDQQRLGCPQGFRQPPLLQQLAYALYLKLHGAHESARVVSSPLAPRGTKSAAETRASETVSERHAEDPRPQRRLRDDELIGADEYAGVRIAEVLAVDVDVPGILRDTARGIVGRVSGILEAQPPGTDGSGSDRRIGARLGE